MPAPVLVDDVPGLSHKQRALCRRAGVYSAEQLVLNPVGQLLKQLPVGLAEATLIQRLASIHLGAPSTSSLDALTGRQRPIKTWLELAQESETYQAGIEELRSASNHGRGLSSAFRIPLSPRTGNVAARYARDGKLVAPSQIVNDSQPALSNSFVDAATYHHNSKERPVLPWAYESRRGDLIIPPSQVDEEDSATGHVQSEMLFNEQYYRQVPLPPSPKALGKRRVIEPPATTFRVKRRLIATSDAEGTSAASDEDNSSDVEESRQERTMHDLSDGPVQDAAERAWLSTGDIELDHILGGGLRKGMVTEIVGESSSGKTQLALQLAISTVLGADAQSQEATSTRPKQPRGVAILTPQGESTATSLTSRLVEMAIAGTGSTFSTHVENESAADVRSATDDPRIAALLQNVHVACLRDAEGLEHALAYTLPGLQERLSVTRSEEVGPLALIIIEGLPTFLQDDSAATNKVSGRLARAQVLCSIAARLRSLCVGVASASTLSDSPPQDHELAVVVINHVSDAFDQELDMVQVTVREGHVPIHELELDRVRCEHMHKLPHGLAIAADAASEAPLALDIQAIHSSGLLSTIPSSISSAGVRAQRDASGQELSLSTDDFVRALKGRLKFAQLGNVWTNCVQARLVLCRTARRVPTTVVPNHSALSSATARQSNNAQGAKRRKHGLGVIAVRRASVAFSAFAPSGLHSGAHVDFVITAGRGFQSIPAEEELDRLSSLTQAQRRDDDRKARLSLNGDEEAGLDDVYDFEHEADEEIERWALDVEMEAALASHNPHSDTPAESDGEDKDGGDSSKVAPTSASTMAPQQLAGADSKAVALAPDVVPASSLPKLDAE